MKPRGNKPSLLPALAGWIDEWLRIKWKKIIRRKIKNTIKENRGGKDNHGSREKNPTQKTGHFSRQRDRCPRQKLFQVSKGKSKCGISFTIALVICEALYSSHLFLIWNPHPLYKASKTKNYCPSELLNKSKASSSFQNFLDFVYPYNNEQQSRWPVTISVWW